MPVTDGRAATSGDCVVAGVPGTGAPVVTEYLDPAGAVRGALLPTGSARDTVTVPGSGPVEVSLVDLAGPVAFVRAADLGLDPLLEPSAANGEEARTASPALPRLALVGDGHRDRAGDFSLRTLSMGRMHHACPMTVLMCAAAAALLPGTIPRAATLARGAGEGGATVSVAHATVDSVSITRTARRLLAGEAYL